MNGCVFCSAKFRSAGRVLFEDDLCMAVPDDNPVEKGHLLVIPKVHYRDMLETPNKVVMRIFAVAKLFGLRLEEKLGASGINVTTNIGKCAGQSVFHFHVHVIPRYPSGAHSANERELTAKELEMLKTD